MFEQPIVGVTVADGRAERVGSGPTVAFSLSISARRPARSPTSPSKRGRWATSPSWTSPAGARRSSPTSNPEIRDARAGDVEAGVVEVVRRHGNLGAAADAVGRARWPARCRCWSTSTAVRAAGFTYGLFPQFMTGVSQVDPYPTTTFAGRGFAVLFPMPRGGAGYGEAGQRAIVNAWGEGDYKDIMAGVDKLIADGIADPDRLGVMGASYGGYMTNWIVTQTGRFKAASAGASLSDLPDQYYLSEGGEFMVDYFKLPWENVSSYTAHSPLTFARTVTTPLLIQHGEVDPRVPIASAWKFYRALKAMGKTVELEIYPRGGHVLREPNAAARADAAEPRVVHAVDQVVDFGVELQRDAVHAIALPGRLRAVGKHVAEMSAAPRTMHLDASHAVRAVLGRPNRAFERTKEARPPRAALIFRVG